MICDECRNCPIKDLCDAVDKIIDKRLTLSGEHDILLAIYEKGISYAINKFVALVNSMPTVEDDYDGYIRPMTIEEMADLIKGAKNDRRPNLL